MILLSDLHSFLVAIYLAVLVYVYILKYFWEHLFMALTNIIISKVTEQLKHLDFGWNDQIMIKICKIPLIWDLINSSESFMSKYFYFTLNWGKTVQCCENLNVVRMLLCIYSGKSVRKCIHF